jgi:hypothetical protein
MFIIIVYKEAKGERWASRKADKQAGLWVDGLVDKWADWQVDRQTVR